MQGFFIVHFYEILVVVLVLSLIWRLKSRLFSLVEMLNLLVFSFFSLVIVMLRVVGIVVHGCKIMK